MTLQRLDEMRALLEKYTVPCFLCLGTGFYPTRLEILQGRAENSYTCDCCGGSGSVPDPKWAPMLALCHNSRRVASCDDACGLARLDADEWWSSLPEGALAGAIREAAWHAGISRSVLDDEFAEIFGADSPNQAAVDWVIKRLKNGCG